MTRQAELETMDWQAIRDIAEGYGIKKPSTGWKDAIPEILEFEEIMGDELQTQSQSQVQTELPLTLEKLPEKPAPEVNSKESKPKNKPCFATDYYKATGIPFCPECGAPKTTVDGVQICPVGNKDCDFIGS